MKKKIQYGMYFFFSFCMILLCAVGVIVYRLMDWVMDTWGLLSIDEIIFHLKVPLEGTNTDIVWDGINACLPIAILIILAMFVLVLGMMKTKKRVFVICTFLITCISLEFGVKAANNVYVELGVKDYLESQEKDSTFIQNAYVDPRSVEITFPEQKRNLIYIFLESMESTYASVEEGGAYEENYIPELTELAKNYTSFSNTDLLGGAYPTVGSTWTMAAMFTQTSGLPLKVDGDSNAANAFLAENSTFSSSACNLEDILAENGYKQCFLLGSDATFGGRRAYFSSHGECEIWDILTAKELGKLPENYHVWWGYEDAKLFEYAKEKLNELSTGEEPFNLTLLTVDTHFEDGYVCDLCQDDCDGNRYGNVMRCSSRQIAAFIEWIQQQPFYENTTIVLSGDHLTMDSDFCEGLEDYQRGVYNAFINLPEELNTSYEQTHNRMFTTIDMLPTTLASLGVSIEGNKLALGTNLFSEEQTLAEQYGYNELDKLLLEKSTFYDLLINDIDY